MQTNNEYRALMARCRRTHLANIRTVSREIERLYIDAAADLASIARKSKKGSITERWAAEYARQLRKRIRFFRDDLFEHTMNGLRRSASLVPDATSEWFSFFSDTSFADVFANTPDDVLAEILSGGIYKDHLGLSKRIWGISHGLEKDVDYIINRGIEAHQSARDMAKALEEYVKDPAKRSWDWKTVYPNLAGKKIDYNAQRLARTSINHSYFLSNVKTCERNPFVTAMHWELSSEHYRRQVEKWGEDECDEFSKHEEGLGTGNYPADKIPLPHPQCLCVQWAVIPRDLRSIGSEIGAWMNGAPNPKLDRWYSKYGT